MGHDILAVLRDLGAVAGGAVIGADDDVDLVAVMVEGIGMAVGAQRMALVAADDDLPQRFGNLRRRHPSADRLLLQRGRRRRPAVATLLPGGHQPGVQFAMATKTLLGFRTDTGILPVSGNGRSQDKRSGQQQAEIVSSSCTIPPSVMVAYEHGRRSFAPGHSGLQRPQPEDHFSASSIRPANLPVWHSAFICDLITMTWQLASSSPHFTGQAEKIRPAPPAPASLPLRLHFLTISIYNKSCQPILTA